MSITKAASLADDLVQRFEEQIDAGDLPPGSRFPTEKAITEAFGVSRTVVREAYSRLAARGLLESRRGSGAFVADGAHFRAFQITPSESGQIEDVLRLLEMRMGFEVEMAGLAAQRRSTEDLNDIRAAIMAMDSSTDVDSSVAADSAFHAGIARATQNDYFVRFTQFLGVRFVPSRQLYLQGRDPAEHQRYARGINRDHEDIYAAIKAEDAPTARLAARTHIEKSIDRYRTLRDAMEG